MLLSVWLNESLSLMSIKPKTRITYESLVRYLIKNLGDCDIASLTPLSIQRFVSSSNTSASRTRQAYRLLHQSLDMATTYDLLTKNPCLRIKLPRMPKRDIVCLSLSDIDRLSAAAGPYGLMLKFMAYTGLRWGETVALQHKHITDRTIHVTRTQVDLNGRLTYGVPKNHCARTVYLPKSLALPPGDPEDLVFTSPRGKQLRSNNFTRNVWHPAITSLGMPDLRIHDLRHTACALLIRANVHPKVIQQLMGHSSITVTMDTYGHLLGDQLQAASVALDGLITG